MSREDEPLGQASSDEAHVFATGSSVGAYRVRRFIASGGMGEVYEAESLCVDAPVNRIALKTIRVDRVKDDKARKRFERECQVVGVLDHPNIARVFSSGVENGTPFIAMDLLEGETLAQKLEREGALSANALLGIVDPVCRALAHAHAKGIVHRDIKPSNIFIEKNRVVLTDFGIALASFTATDVSSTGVAVGTPAYLSPEQILDEPVTPASDVYALGILIFECLTGHYPFAGDTPISQAVARLTQPAPRVSDSVKSVPRRLDDLVARCLARDVAARPTSALDVVRALTDALTNSRPRAARVLSGVGVVVLVFATVVLTPRLRERAEALDAVLRHRSPEGPFLATGSMKVGRDGHTGTLLPDGTVLIVGGTNGDVLDSAEIYDPSHTNFRLSRKLTSVRRAHTATRLRDGRILILGGDGDSGAFATAEIYNPVTRGFAPTGTMAQARDAHTATLLADGRVLVTGGGYATVRATVTAEIYDPRRGSFSSASPMRSSRLFHAAVRLKDGRVLIVSGWGGETNASSALLRSGEIYDPRTGAFSYTGELHESRYAPSATLLRDGRVLVVGGYGPGNVSRSSAEVYDPATGRFSLLSPLATARTFHTATLLPSGSVLVAGGYFGTKRVDAELFDPATNRFRPAGKMTSERYGHVAVPLPDGSVLLAGGVGAGYQKSAEVFREPR